MEKLDEARARVVLEDLFCREGAPFGQFDQRSAKYSQGIIAGTHEFVVFPHAKGGARRHRAVAHRVVLYPGLGDVAGTLWEQMARTLLRLRLRATTSLPRIVAAAYSESHKVAFVNSEIATKHLGMSDVVERVASTTPAGRQSLVRALVDLIHSLSILHGQGILHRGIRPESIEYLPSDDGGFTLRLSRFEMSTFVSSMFEDIEDNARAANRLRAVALLERDPQAFLCASPEQLADGDALETDRSDMFSLGVLAWWWLSAPAARSTVLSVFAKGGHDEATRRAVHDEMKRALVEVRAMSAGAERDEAWIPAKLAELIGRMLVWEPHDRISSHELATELSLHLDALLAPWDEELDQTFFLGTMPEKAKSTLYAWGKLKYEPETEAGTMELVELVERDLRRGHIAYAPEGFGPWADAVDPKFKETNYVLVGAEFAWFCNPYFDRRLSPVQRVDELLLIRFVLDLGRYRREIERLSSGSYVRVVPPVSVVPIEVRACDPEMFRAQGKSWAPYLKSVRRKEEAPIVEGFGDSLRLLLEWQNAELVVRTFPFMRLDNLSSRYIRLQVDTERRQEQLFRRKSPLPAFLVSQQPIGMRPLFEGLSEGRTAALAIYPADDPEEPLGNANLARDRVSSENAPPAPVSSDEDIITIEAPDDFYVPSRGWIRPADDFGSDVQAGRQARALEELLDAPELRDQLHSPLVLADMTPRWTGAGAHLDGGADAVVRRMLGTEPLFAVQGPPGTGKTTVVASAVAAFLQKRTTARVLVSAQSNYALDNLAERVLAGFPREERPIAYRVTPARGPDERVSKPMQEYALDKVAERLVKQIQDACIRRLADPDFRRWHELDQEVLGEVANHIVEIRDRVRRAANLVFATCLTATAENVETLDEFSLFDWVIVEEAAKCWLTEMAVPLLRGRRWTLVGDHKQLPAFRRDDLDRLLDKCATSSEPRLRMFADGERRRLFEKAYDFFEHLFDAPPGEQGPTAALTLQFRMPKLIGDVVGHTFYPSHERADTSFLRTADSKKHVPPPWQAPEWLRARHPLVWIDTSEADCEDLPYWSNPGEAEIVAKIVAQVRPRPRAPQVDVHTDRPHSLVVLTPYLRQHDLLRRRLAAHDAAWSVETIDAFQGREAELVIVSLVRSTRRGSTPQGSIGYLIKEQRVNVLLSRARKTLVVVGNFELFQTIGVTFWERLCAQMTAHGVVVRARDLGLTAGRPT